MKKSLLITGLFVSSLRVGFAQQTASVAGVPADTTTSYMGRSWGYSWGELDLMDGRKIQAYLPVDAQYPGLESQFVYYLTRPEKKPLPPKQIVRVAEVRSMRAGSHYYETMRLPTEKKAKILAERVVNGPVELFLQAEQQQAPLPIPVADVLVHAAIPYKNSHFFVRRDGVLTKVNRGVFNAQMSQYLIDYPALAEKVARAEKMYHYRDLITIIMKYNRYVENLQGSK